MARILSPQQSAALLDILTHNDTYSEIREFRYPGALDHYGPPFTAAPKAKSRFPGLQALISRFVLNLPGLRDVPDTWWTVQIKSLIEDLEDANLSESYDKGSVGSRKTLSTAVSALIEYPIRGTFGGFARVKESNQDYDLKSAEDLSRGFRDFVDQCIYGNVLADLKLKAAETDQLDDHSNLIKAVHEFVLVNLASFMHYTLILSPKGQYLLKLIDNANRLVPYMAIRQTLKIGNVATMMSAMIKVVLAKMSVAGITNWLGLTNSQNDGMNLMQTIISTVLNWDIKELETRITKIEKDSSAPTRDQLAALTGYTTATRDKQEELRQRSMTSSTSIVITILDNTSTLTKLSDDEHKLALEYLSCKLAVRDRKEIARVFCHRHPDHLTTTVRLIFDAYEPVIRGLHNAVDLSDTMIDFQAFVTDLLKMARIQPPGKDGQTLVPTVGDFILLLRKHQYSSHKFIHQLAKNGKEVTEWYLKWAEDAAAQFRTHTQQSKSSDTVPSGSGAGDLTEPLTKLFVSLPEDQQKSILPILDQQTSYLEKMHQASIQRFSHILSSAPAASSAAPSPTTSRFSSILSSSRSSSRSNSPVRFVSRRSTNNAQDRAADDTTGPTSASHEADSIPKVNSTAGPGGYLARWQDLLDSTPVTPLTAHGKPQRASDKAVVENSATDVDGGKMVELNVKDTRAVTAGRKPDTKVVIDAMGKQFRDLLAERSCYW